MNARRISTALTLLRSWAGDFGRTAAELLFPPVCIACGRLGKEPFCPLCAEAVEPAPSFEIEGAVCARAVWAYGGPVVEAIHSLKYQGRVDIGRAVGRSMRAQVSGFGPIDLVVPVPLSEQRLVARGYNQSLELARALGFSVATRGLHRISDRGDQVGLGRRARHDNVASAFRAGDGVYGHRLLLVDDVVTTGATATAAVEALRYAGAREVYVLALARTV